MKYYTVKITYCETTTQTVVAGGNSIEEQVIPPKYEVEVGKLPF